VPNIRKKAIEGTAIRPKLVSHDIMSQQRTIS